MIIMALALLLSFILGLFVMNEYWGFRLRQMARDAGYPVDYWGRST